MIRFEVEKGHLLDINLREGHIWSSGELFDSLEEAEAEFKNIGLSMTASEEYTSLNRIEFDEDAIVQCDVIEITYRIDLVQELNESTLQ